MDNPEVVQSQEPVPPTEQVLPPTEPLIPPVEAQPLTEERIRQMIAEATAKVVEPAKQLGRRELQSEQDRNKAELARMQRRARTGEETLATVRYRVRETDPDLADKLELEELRARDRGRATLEQEEATRAYQEEIVRRFQEDMTQHISDLGFDPNDPRIDWATDAPDLLTAHRKILASVAKMQKEKTKAADEAVDRKIGEAEGRIKKSLGYEEANSVSAQSSAGISGDGIPLDMAKFRAWIANIPQEEYEKKYASKVKEMMDAGKIK